MASRTKNEIIAITVCFFLVYNVNTMTADLTTTQDHSETLLNTGNSLVSSPTHSAETTVSPALHVTNTTFSNTSATKLNASEPSQFSTSTAAATTQSTVKVSESSTLGDTSMTTSPSNSTSALAGPSVSSINKAYSTTSGVIHVVTTLSPTQTKPTTQNNGTGTTPNGTATTVLSDTEKYSMNYSEIILTSIFGTMLVVVAFVIVSFGLKRCLRSSSQYSHHPLRETSYEADGYSPPDDTLVISGGLYDAPRIYNPNMTVLEEEEPQNGYASINSSSGQFRLEFLPGDKDMDPVFNGSQRRNV